MWNVRKLISVYLSVKTGFKTPDSVIEPSKHAIAVSG